MERLTICDKKMPTLNNYDEYRLKAHFKLKDYWLLTQSEAKKNLKEMESD